MLMRSSDNPYLRSVVGRTLRAMKMWLRSVRPDCLWMSS